MTLTSPAHNEVVTTEVIYRWTPVRLASAYEIQLAGDANFSPGQIVGSCITNHTAYVPYYGDGCINLDIAASSTWWWRVRPLDGQAPDILGVWSPAQRVTWDPISPRAGSSLWVENDNSYTPTVVWNPILDRSTFRVKVYNSSGNATTNETVTGTSWTPKTLLDPGTYSVSITPIDVQNRPQAEPTPSLRVTMSVTAPGPPVASIALLSPPSGASVTAKPVLTWTPVTGADVYRVYYVTPGSDGNILVDVSGPLHATSFSTTHVSSMDDGTYAWMVIPYTGTGLGAASQLHLAVRPDPSVLPGHLLSPNHCTAQSPCQAEFETPFLDWQSEYGVEAWMVYIASDPQFTNLVTDDGNPERTPHTSMKLTYSLKDSQAGQSFYWYARPCRDGPATVDLSPRCPR